MDRVRLSAGMTPDSYWLRFYREDGTQSCISLEGCANSFALVTQNRYASEDGLRCVGWRYEEDGCLCYELFCVGHVVLYMPLKPDVFNCIRYLLRGNKPQEAHEEALKTFESALNRGGWKTVVKD
jgi:hypothetical protein